MSEPDDYKSALLDFLTHNIDGRERDAVTRAFYEYAEGDPHSHPVGMAILLTACARQMARLPDNVRLSLAEFQALLDKVIHVDKDLAAKIAGQQLQWKNDLERANIGFIGSIHGEICRGLDAFAGATARANESWIHSAERLEKAQEETEQAGQRLVPITDSARQIAERFASLKIELELHKESHQRAIDAVDSVKIIHQENQRQGHDTLLLLKSISKEARANWITMGYLSGIFLASLFYHMPWWGTWGSFAAMLGLLQWLSRLETKPRQEQPTDPARNAVKIPKSGQVGPT
jgi:hypothetical protein